jgi:RHS repeat-associated protein
MQYDALDRLTQRNYSDGTPTASFNYDETSARSVTLANTTDRMSSEATASPNPTAKIFSYDKLGRVKNNSQCTPQNCGAGTVFPITYNYDLLGDMTSSTNGMGVTLSYTVNRALRLTGTTSSLSDSNHPGTLYSSPHYNGAGSLLSAQFGNTGSSVNESRTYDGRLRLTGITDGSLYTLTVPTNGYAPDSDVLLANDSVNGNWTYGYDAFNRLTSASATGQSYTYDYDRFGNRWHQNGPHSSSLSFSGNNNRMDTYSYDAAGNLLNDGTTAYTYDSESRIISATNSTSGTSTYLYDADGRRIRKTTTAGGAVDFLFDLRGHEITQVTSAGSWNRGEIYAGGRHLGTYSGGTGGTTYFNFSDWLGTERARSLPGTTTACETITSLPFGDGQTTTGSCGDPSPMHFTGKERDSESGLDNFGARYDSSQYGRFMSVDPSRMSINRANPQTWNRYSYALNNPLAYVDQNGLWPTRIHNEIIEAVFGGVLSRHQVELLKSVSADQDSISKGGQRPENSNIHGQCAPGQSMGACSSGIANHVSENLAKARIVGNVQGLSDSALTYFGVAGHTLTDMGSPSHVGPDGTPTTWYGIFGQGALGHVE